MPGSFFLELKTLGIPEATGLVSQIDHELKQGLRGRLKEAAKMVSDQAASLSHSRRVRAAMGFDVEVRSLVEYHAVIGPVRRRAFFAHFLEFGTEHSRAFPFAAPALEATEERVVDLIGIPPVLGGGR